MPYTTNSAGQLVWYDEDPRLAALLNDPTAGLRRAGPMTGPAQDPMFASRAATLASPVVHPAFPVQNGKFAFMGGQSTSEGAAGGAASYIGEGPLNDPNPAPSLSYPSGPSPSGAPLAPTHADGSPVTSSDGQMAYDPSTGAPMFLPATDGGGQMDSGNPSILQQAAFGGNMTGMSLPMTATLPITANQGVTAPIAGHPAASSTATAPPAKTATTGTTGTSLADLANGNEALRQSIIKSVQGYDPYNDAAMKAIYDKSYADIGQQYANAPRDLVNVMAQRGQLGSGLETGGQAGIAEAKAAATSTAQLNLDAQIPQLRAGADQWKFGELAALSNADLGYDQLHGIQNDMESKRRYDQEYQQGIQDRQDANTKAAATGFLGAFGSAASNPVVQGVATAGLTALGVPMPLVVGAAGLVGAASTPAHSSNYSLQSVHDDPSPGPLARAYNAGTAGQLASNPYPATGIAPSTAPRRRSSNPFDRGY